MAYLRREICASKSIGLALSWKEIYRFGFVLLCRLRTIFQVQAAGGAYIWRGDLTEGLLRYRFAFGLGGLRKEDC